MRSESPQPITDESRYRQSATDVIGIYWQFHKEMVVEGLQPFAFSKNPNTYALEPYSPKNRIKIAHKLRDFSRHKVLDEYSEAVDISLCQSWARFMVNLGFIDDFYPADYPELSKRSKRFLGSYTKNLVKESLTLAPQSTLLRSLENDELPEVIDSGIHTAAETSTQLAAFFGRDFQNAQAMQLSKLSLVGLAYAVEDLGFKEGRSSFKQDHSNILDATGSGFSNTRLEELGLRSALGCPAAMTISSETRKFLEGIGITVRGTTVSDFSTLLGEHINKTLLPWYRGLNPELRKLLIDPEQDKMLSGEARESLWLLGLDNQTCPVAH